MPDAPLDPVRAQNEALRARIGELEAQLTALRQQQARPHPRLDDSPPAQTPGDAERFPDVLDSVGLVVTLLDAGGRILRASPASLHLLGGPAETIQGQPILACIHPEDREEGVRFFERARSHPGERLGPLSLRAVPREGQAPGLEVVACNCLDNPEVGAIVACWSDNTSRSQASQALRDREEYYRQLLETMRAVPWEAVVPDLRADPPAPLTFRYVGPQAEALLGYPLQDWYGPGFWEAHLHPEDREAAIRLCLESTLRGKDHTFEYRMLGADGRVVWVLDLVHVLLHEGQPVLCRGFLLDISQRKQAELALQQSQEWSRLALETGAMLAHVLDLTTNRISASADLANFFGAPPGIILDRFPDFLKVVHPDDRNAYQADLQRALAQGGDVHTEFRGAWPARDGELAWFRRSGRVQRDEAGRAVRLVGVVANITARKRQEEERRRLEAHVYQTQHFESLGVLAGGIAHEFNNLLTSLIGYTDLARAELSTESPAHGYLAEVLTAGRRAAELTQQILAYAGKGRFVLQPVDLAELVRQMSPLLSAIASRKTTLMANLSPVPAVEGDLSQLRQIILHLVRNASEALGEQEGTITVRTGMLDLEGPGLEVPPGWVSPGHPADFQGGQRHGRYTLLEVIDTGEGMDEATLARIFEPFFTTRFTGRGLGLAAVLGIVRGHGGLVRVTSAPDEGSCFQVLLPALPEPLESTSAPPPSPTERGQTVLVVEDDPAVRSLAILVLSQAGYTIVQAGDGLAGLELFRQRPGDFDVVLLDLTMPRLNGLEVLGELRQLRPDIRVVLMTGYNTSDLASQPSAPSVSTLLQKPFSPEALLQAIRNALDGTRRATP